MKDTQKWSKIAKAHLDEINKREIEKHGDKAVIQTMITQGDLELRKSWSICLWIDTLLAKSLLI